MNNLNYDDLGDGVKAILRLERGIKNAEDAEDADLVDTREPLEDFRSACHEFGAKEKELGGMKYYTGVLQTAKGFPRRDFLFIPGNEWNIIQQVPR